MTTVRSQSEAHTYVDESRFALDRIYDELEKRDEAVQAIASKIARLKNDEQLHHELFIDRDQWSPHANFYYGRYIRMVTAIRSRRTWLESASGSRDALQTELARFGATETAMGILGGAMLQISKQAIAYRFGGSRPPLPAKMIGSQTIVEIVWEGRNHVMHWEENAPRARVIEMLTKVNADFGLVLDPSENNSMDLLGVLGWSNAEQVVDDLHSIMDLEPS